MSRYSLDPIAFSEADQAMTDREARLEWPLLHGDGLVPATPNLDRLHQALVTEAPMETYRVVRMFRDSSTREVLRRGLSLRAAQAHCRNPETSSSTCTSPEAQKRTEQFGPWFDGYDKE